MYHIKDDLRCRKSTQMICDAMEELLQEKSLEEITVRDLQERSTISRATFYRNFDSLGDVLLLRCDQGFKECFDNYMHAPDAAETDLAAEVFHYWFQHSDILMALVEGHRVDILFQSVRSALARLDFLPLLSENERNASYLSSILASTMAGIILAWAENGRKESMQELGILLREQFQLIAALGVFR